MTPPFGADKWVMVGDGDAVNVDLFLGGGVIDSPCVFDEVAHDESASAAARTGAARAALDAGLRLAELVSLSDRVAALEARQDQEQARRDDLLIGGLRSGDI